MKSKTPMTLDEIASQIGWEGVELELVTQLDAPPAPGTKGLVTSAELPIMQFCDHVEVDGITLARILDEPWCVAVGGVPAESGGTSHPMEGGVVLDGRRGDAWVRFEGKHTDHVVYNAKGEVSVCRVQPSSVVLSLRALSRPVVEFEAALPSLDDLVRVAQDHPHTPSWLAEATGARAGDELVRRLDAIGIVARYAHGPAVDSIRRWAQALAPSDTVRLERMVARHVERAYDAVEDAIDGDPSAMQKLVCCRDRLESLLALRSFAGMGSPVRESVQQLDDHVLDQLVNLPAPPVGAFDGDPSLGAADGFAPDVWWAEYAR